jgi:DNA-binding beta-propeller fold protein YncE
MCHYKMATDHNCCRSAPLRLVRKVNSLSTFSLGKVFRVCVGMLTLLMAIIVPATNAQSIQTFAGTGEKGFSGEGGEATSAKLDDPTGIVRGPDGALYVCDTANHRIRKVTSDGKIVTVAGTGERGWSGDGGPALAAKLNEPYEVRCDAAGNVYWVERLSHCVRKLEARKGVVTTIAGNGLAGFSGDDGPATKAQLNDPHSIGFDKAGDLYICDVKNHRIRKVNLKSGVISTFAGTGERKPTTDGARFAKAPLHGPRALDFDRDGNLWLALREGNAIYKLDLAQGTVQHIAGTGKKGFTGNGGPVKEATLNGPKGLSVAPDGKVYIADTENHAIRMIDVKSGTIDVVAGTGARGNGPAGDPRKCQLARPHGVFVDSDGSLFIGDSETHRVRVIRPEVYLQRGAEVLPPRVFLWDAKHVATTRQRIREGAPSFAAALAALNQDAQKALKAGPFSVMQKTNVPPSGDRHDYMSIAPYFWPDPAKSNGLPYIRRDGERNPANRTTDRRHLAEMIEAVETLSQGWYFTGEVKYATKARELLRTWFLDPATRMNPNFEFGQAVPGVNTGRGIGLIETAGLTGVVDAIGLLADSPAWTQTDQREMEKWFGEFLRWMLESKHGRDEAAAKNNHGTWYDVQVASFALFAGRPDIATNVLRAAGEKRIARQIEPDGRQPLELARTKAWGYSTMNLRGLMSLATLGEHVGVDLWHFETPDGRSLRGAFDFLTPFALRERKWPYQQLGGWSPEGYSPLAERAGSNFREARYVELAIRVRGTNRLDRASLLLSRH